MTEALDISYDPALVLHQLQSQKIRLDGHSENIRAFLALVGDLAESLMDTEQPQTEAAQSTAKSLLDLEAETKAYAAALEATKHQYVPSERITNFQQDIEQHAKRLLPVFRTDPKDNEAYQEFCDKLDIEEEEEEEEQGNSDDEVQEQRGNTVAMNRFCPLSGKPLLEIQDPVTDQKGYVYDRASVLFYIKEQGGSAQCPAANHTITAADLKKAHKVIREQKKAAQQGSQYQTQQQSQDVVDVD